MKKPKFAKIDPFNLCIYFTHVDEWKLKKKEILSLVDFNDKIASEKYENLTYSDYGMDKSYPKFVDMLEPYLKIFHDSVYKYQRIGGPWCQKQLAGDYHRTHDHGCIGYSAVFYAKINPDVHGGTDFISPFPYPIDGGVQSRSFKTIEGDLLFFPAHLLHSSTPHKSDEERIIFSFNLF